jgi:DNA-binding NarL/FixJ family response regulator
MKIAVGIVDDHQLFLKSLSLMLAGTEDFNVVVEAVNGKDLQEKVSAIKTIPDIILIDVSMPVMDGIATAAWLTEHYPAIRLAALSMDDSDKAIIAMIKAGCCAYLLKDIHPAELEKAIHEIYTKGYYNGDASNINYRRLLKAQRDEEELKLNDNERQFLQLSCSDLTYKQIAAKMNKSERTIDGYREDLFKKFNVQSRVGLVLEAIRRDLVKL